MRKKLKISIILLVLTLVISKQIAYCSTMLNRNYVTANFYSIDPPSQDKGDSPNQK